MSVTMTMDVAMPIAKTFLKMIVLIYQTVN